MTSFSGLAGPQTGKPPAKRLGLLVVFIVLALLAVAGGVVYSKLKPKLPLISGFTGDMPFTWRPLDANPADRARASLDGALTVHLVENAGVLAYQGVKSTFPKDLRGKSVSIQTDLSRAADTPLVEAKFRVTLDHYDDYISIQAEGDRLNTIQAAKKVEAQRYFPFDRTRDRFWRISHDAARDEIAWAVSADRIHWRELRREPRRLPLDKVRLEIYAGTFKPTPKPGQVRFTGCC